MACFGGPGGVCCRFDSSVFGRTGLEPSDLDLLLRWCFLSSLRAPEEGRGRGAQAFSRAPLSARADSSSSSPFDSGARLPARGGAQGHAPGGTARTGPRARRGYAPSRRGFHAGADGRPRGARGATRGARRGVHFKDSLCLRGESGTGSASATGSRGRRRPRRDRSAGTVPRHLARSVGKNILQSSVSVVGRGTRDTSSRRYHAADRVPSLDGFETVTRGGLATRRVMARARRGPRFPRCPGAGYDSD